MYLGIAASETIGDLKLLPGMKEKDMKIFFTSVLNFYTELVTIVKKKFDFRDELYNIISVVDPEVAQGFKIKSLKLILKRFPTLENFVDLQALDIEWRRHAFLDHQKEELHATLSAEKYWKKVFMIKTVLGEPAFPNLNIVMKYLLVLPFSNASVERIFSTLRNCKTVHRNRLGTDTLVALIATKEGVREQNGCVDFEPNQSMLEATLWDY